MSLDMRLDFTFFNRRMSMFESTTTLCRLRRFFPLLQQLLRKGLSMVLSPFYRAPIYGLIVSTPGRSEESRNITNKSVIFTFPVPCCAQHETVNGKLVLCFLLFPDLRKSLVEAEFHTDGLRLR